ncbi:translation initiation factor IF-1 [[Mycoplasma] falconis]|uniref:Translation initiation factor IF-1 n=1 Tax=[Mycoplasma] falconis TaxID=92403 RepID=A0A501XBJ5_9BACT|nr:translation initiation factor IF-1 [[Mycoplasma] falconis]TPE57998.1 translation initiation factor IF-1 [[Mycoplasma] falconis]
MAKNAKDNNTIKMSGKIVKMHSSKDYEVLLDNDMVVKCVISGKMKLHNIKMIPGDRVDVELPVVNLNLGRIVFRHK